MLELTVGYVAGIIAAVVVVVRLWTPNTLVYIISGLLGDKNTAATWNVAGRALHSSLWPELVRADTGLNRGVRWDIRILTTTIQLMTALIAVAGVVTPLGLYSVLAFGDSTTPTFHHVRDEGPYGIATPPRSNLTFGRECNYGLGGLAIPIPCPYTPDVSILNETNDNMPYSMTREIPDIVQEIYSSGTSGWANTIANYFDIEWRTWTTGVSKFYNNETQFLTAAYRQMASVILREDVIPVEGLIVDMQDGGLGFRNHTIPIGVGQGGAWDEDILFILPETTCVDTNLSLAFDIPTPNINKPLQNGSISDWEHVRLIDNGGFAKLNTTYPYYAHAEAQTNPDLQGRAYKAAWLTNAYTALLYNVTNPSNETTGRKAWQYLNSQVGKEFPIEYESFFYFDRLEINDNYGTHLGFLTSSTQKLGTKEMPNPFQITGRNFSDTQLICRGAGNNDIANISSILVECGFIRGAAVRTDGGNSKLFEAGSKWKAPLYTCATAIKATIKTTSFLLNGTSGLSSLSITGSRPKSYPSKEGLPLWGVEDTGYVHAQFTPIWGLIGPDYEKFPNISVVRKESLYIPGYPDTVGLTARGSSNMPGSDFAKKTLVSVYSHSAGSISGPPTDYTGRANLALYAKWQRLSSSPATAGKMIDLIWTDMASSAVVSTKGALGGRKNSHGQAQIFVHPIRTQIKYRWAFAIPAFLVLFLCLAIALFALIIFIFHRHNYAKLRKHLHQTAAGRILTSFLYPEYSNLNTSTRAWGQSVGRNVIDLSGDNALMVLLATNNFYKGHALAGDNHLGDGLRSPAERGVATHEGELNESHQMLVPDRVPSPYQGAKAEHENYPLTNLSGQHQQGFR